MSILGFLDYNWALVLLLVGMLVLVLTNVHLTKKTSALLYTVILLVAALSAISYIETQLGNAETVSEWRTILTAAKYSIPPFIMAFVGMAFLTHGMRKISVFSPAAINAVLCVISIFNGVVFSIDKNNAFHRGVLNMVPFAVNGIYLVLLLWRMFKTGGRAFEDLFTIVFLAASVTCSIVLPLLWGVDFEKWFCVTVAICVFVYYCYLTQQLTKKDALTGLLNRQSYYSDIERSGGSITAVVSLDMNGLKECNDTDGHAAGDRALAALAGCFLSASLMKQRVYRVGGDEFMILCRHTDEAELEHLVARIRKNLEHSGVSCSVGSAARKDKITVEELIRQSDERMYAEKAAYYAAKGQSDRT